MSTLLNQFQNEPFMREEVRTFFLEQLNVMALRKVYADEDVKGVAHARESLLQAFDELEAQYGQKKKEEVKSIR